MNNKRKQELINDIEHLLNSYGDNNSTKINPDLLQFMDENTLIQIIDSLLRQKENLMNVDTKWLEKFKKYDS